MTHRARWLPLGVAAALASTLAGGACAGAERAPPASVSTTAAGIATTDLAPREAYGDDDTTHALLRAAYGVARDEGQRAALDDMRAKLDESGREIRAPIRQLNVDLGAGVRAARLDPAEMRADEAAIDTAVRAHLAVEADTLNALHVLLDAAQRKALAGAIRGADARRERIPSPRRALVLDALARDLELDDEQTDRVAQLLAKTARKCPRPDAEAWLARRSALLAAFESDRFDARAAPWRAQVSAETRARVACDVDVIAELLTVLRGDQRDRLARRIERRLLRVAGDDD